MLLSSLVLELCRRTVEIAYGVEEQATATHIAYAFVLPTMLCHSILLPLEMPCVAAAFAATANTHSGAQQ